jgi:hypothetical protein
LIRAPDGTVAAIASRVQAISVHGAARGTLPLSMPSTSLTSPRSCCSFLVCSVALLACALAKHPAAPTPLAPVPAATGAADKVNRFGFELYDVHGYAAAHRGDARAGEGSETALPLVRRSHRRLGVRSRRRSAEPPVPRRGAPRGALLRERRSGRGAGAHLSNVGNQAPAGGSGSSTRPGTTNSTSPSGRRSSGGIWRPARA